MPLRILLPLLVRSVLLAAWTPDDMLKVNGVGNVQVSPDGRQVVFTVTRHQLEYPEPITHVWLVQSDGSRSVQLTRGDRWCTGPRWSPDGKRIAFLSARSGSNNIWVMSPGDGEGEQLTNSKTGISAFRWSHNGRFIAFTAPAELTAEEQMRRKAREDWQVMNSSHAYHRLWVISVEGKGRPRLLTRQDYHLGGAFGGGFLDWSADDRKIVFAHMPRPKFDDWRKLDIAEVDLDSGRVREVADTQAAEDTPLYSPDGKWIASRASDIPPGWGIDFRIHIVPVSGGEPKALMETYNREPTLVGWTADSRSLIYEEARGTKRVLYRLPLDGAPVLLYEPTEGSFVAASLNGARDALGFSAQSSSIPPEAFVLRLGGQPVQVSHANADAPKLPLGKTGVIRWTGPGGLEVEGLLTYPVNFNPNRRCPLIVISHGGPPSYFSETFIASPGHYPIAAFSSQGFAVLRANVRGSTGYGKTFRYANYRDWGGGDFQDMMAGVDKVIEMGIADSDRLAIAGWSYGGFMTAWAITQTHRFKAASIGAPMTDLTSMNGTADMATFVPDYMGAESWERPDWYVKHSPVYQSKGVTTPALLQHGRDDTVVPIGQSEEYLNALDAQGVPVRMVIYPRSGHSPTENQIVRQIMRDNLDWFEKYLGSKP